jgi:hypothetical protein
MLKNFKISLNSLFIVSRMFQNELGAINDFIKLLELCVYSPGGFRRAPRGSSADLAVCSSLVALEKQ